MANTPGCLYIAHMKDGPMIRIRLPGGRITAQQCRAIAELAESRGNGIIDLTNRANLQIRGLRGITVPQLKKTMGSAGLLPRDLKADRIRNIVADPFSGLDQGALIDTDPIVADLDRMLQSKRSLRGLLPEFEFVIDNGGRSAVGGLPHDVGLIAEPAGATQWFRLSIANIATPLVVQSQDGAALAVAAAEAALCLAVETQLPALRRLSRYTWRAYRRDSLAAAMIRAAISIVGPFENRFRRLVKSIPIEEIVARILETAPAGTQQLSAADRAERTLSPAIGTIAQPGAGFVLCGLGIAVGRMNVAMVRALADFAENFGDGKLRLAPWHTIFIPHVKTEQARELLRRAETCGFVTDPSFLQVRLFACSGVTGCRGGKLNTKDNAGAVAAKLAKTLQNRTDKHTRAMTVHLSGCVKGCAHRQVSDLFALERASGYDIYENCSPGTPPPPDKRIGSASEQQLPGIIAGLIAKKAKTHIAVSADFD